MSVYANRPRHTSTRGRIFLAACSAAMLVAAISGWQG